MLFIRGDKLVPSPSKITEHSGLSRPRFGRSFIATGSIAFSTVVLVSSEEAKKSFDPSHGPMTTHSHLAKGNDFPRFRLTELVGTLDKSEGLLREAIFAYVLSESGETHGGV